MEAIGERAAGEAGPQTRSGALPNVIVIGFQKCGTSALQYYLDLHPEISMSAPKELNFFIDKPEAGHLPGLDDGDLALLPRRIGNAGRGVGWYRSQFDAGTKIRGEASPNYTSPWFPRAAERLHALVPDTRLIVLVRDPSEQVVSSWLHSRGLGIERRPFETALRREGIYLERVSYRKRLQPYLELFCPEQILMLAQADLRDRRRETLRRAFSFLHVDPDFYTPRMERERHVSAAKGPRKRLLERLQRSRPARLGFKLPQEAKWYIERAFSGRAEPAPELTPQMRAMLSEQCSGDAEWLSDVFGIDVGTWFA